MANKFLNYPFDDDIFIHAWGEEPDPVREALISSGVLVEDPRITAALAGDGNYFTIPYYMPLGDGGGVVLKMEVDNIGSGTGKVTATNVTGPANYDGSTDVPVSETQGDMLSGAAYGRTQGFMERDFVPELSGSDPMGHIVRKISTFWNRYRQARLVDVIEAALATKTVTDSALAAHTKEVEIPLFVEKLPATMNTALTQIFGQLKTDISVLVMDSLTASMFENINLLHYEKGVNAGAMFKSPLIGQLLGYTVIVDDSAIGLMPSTNYQYIYALGSGALLTGKPRLDRPAELVRDAIRFGGTTTLVTRMRDVIHPNGFNFIASSVDSWAGSPDNDALAKSDNYLRKYPAKTIPMAKIILKPNSAGESGDDEFKVVIAGIDNTVKIPVEIENTDAILVDFDAGATVEIGNTDPISVTIANVEGTDDIPVKVVNFPDEEAVDPEP